MFKVGSLIILSQELVDKAYEVGKAKHISNRQNGVTDYVKTDSNWYIIDGEGVCGEYAFAQMVDAPQDQWDRINEISPRSAYLGDRGDCMYKDLDFDVKTTKYKTGHLILKQSKIDNLSDAYALFCGFYGQYVFKGVISKQRILENIESFDKREDGSIWIHQDFLRDLP